MTEPCSDLVRFADGELDDGRADAFRAHLAICVACRAELLEAMQLQSPGSFGPAGPRPQDAPGVVGRAGQAGRSRAQRHRRRRPRNSQPGSLTRVEDTTREPTTRRCRPPRDPHDRPRWRRARSRPERRPESRDLAADVASRHRRVSVRAIGATRRRARRRRSPAHLHPGVSRSAALRGRVHAPRLGVCDRTQSRARRGKQRRRRLHHLGEAPNADVADPRPSADESIDDARLRVVLHACLEKLSTKARTAVIVHYQ